MNDNVRRLARTLERGFVQLLLAAAPRREHLIIQGFPVNEGNAIEMLRAAAARYRGRIFWSVPDPMAARVILDATAADPHRRIEPVSHRSWRGVAAFVTAEVAMFTHGFYGNPRPTRRKTLVNLWHGGGFKGNIMCDENGKPTIHSDYLVASSALFGRQLARECALPASRLLLTGNPRVDQFRLEGRQPLERLGLPTDRPMVIWMPTFRRNRGHGLSVGWSEVAGGADINLVSAAREGIRILQEEFGFTVVVKPHPSDAENWAGAGIPMITNEMLADSGVQLYELLGAAAALITDYSSVWIDYLALDRPVGFFVPDEAAYAAGRGFNPPDILDWLPGLRLSGVDAFREFGTDIAGGGRLSSERRAEVAEHIGRCTSDHVADDILDQLNERKVFTREIRAITSTSTTSEVRG